MGFGWEAQQTGKSTGGKGKAAGLYRGVFSAVRVRGAAEVSTRGRDVCLSMSWRVGERVPSSTEGHREFGLSFLNLSYKAPKMALYNAAERRFPICNTKSCRLIYYDALNCKVATSICCDEYSPAAGIAGHPRRPPDPSRQPCREEHRRQLEHCRLGERAGAPERPPAERAGGLEAEVL
jgi:hypothetical protein